VERPRVEGANRRRAAALAVAKAAHEVLRLGEVTLAHRLATTALEVAEDAANLHSVMAGVMEAQGRHAAAIPYWRRAMACAPGSGEHRFNLALALLRQGDVGEGFALQEARYDKEKWTSIALPGSLDGLLHRIPRPGDELSGKRVLLFTEQGLGDCLWAARWLPAFARRGAGLTLATRSVLRPLLEPLAAFEAVLEPPESTADAKINLGALAGRFDAFVPMLSLPWLLGVERPGPDGVPWLQPDAQEVASWRARFEAALPGRLRIIGVVWRANPANQSGQTRSVPPAALAPLSGLAGTGIVALQGGPAQGHGLPGSFQALPTRDIPLRSLAAAIAATDLLVTVDTMAMHLAASMGHPCRVLVATSAPGFVLGDDVKTCRWYPSARLHRQQANDRWEETVGELVAEIAKVGQR